MTWQAPPSNKGGSEKLKKEFQKGGTRFFQHDKEGVEDFFSCLEMEGYDRNRKLI